ncbi:MAG: hypothetical protein PHC28_07835 [Flavobacterium sp.]|uniref:hypothetical protein n=1 Tax=Flavobacterium sp. TaxID=239 RepID=UPI00262F1C31|nr:hypothetical protein [Flavobacterium sp.]MDD5150382.1 hypothetical protein [Flavobacterium sp.]
MLSKELVLLRELFYLISSDKTLLTKTKDGCCGDKYEVYISETALKISEILKHLEPYKQEFL